MRHPEPRRDAARFRDIQDVQAFPGSGTDFAARRVAPCPDRWST
jgi:hypothetical protein